MKKRVYFNKTDQMKFISHLDLLRFFERVLTKAAIPVKYSQGFHPRPKISFGNPVSLGTEAYNEVMDLELERELSNEMLLEKFNSFEIIGFKVLKVEDINDKISIVERFKTAIYKITGREEEIDKVCELLSQEKIIERKEKNGKVIERDLKEKIHGFNRISSEEIEMDISNGSPNSYLKLAGIDDAEVKITKNGYRV